MRNGILLVVPVVLLALAGCAPTPVTQVDAAQPAPVQIQPSALPERVVQLATMTPTFDLLHGTPTPAADRSGKGPTPTPTPFSLRDWGAPVTAYSDRTAGFAFECPVDWTVSPPSEDDRKGGKSYTITLRSTSPIVSRIHPGESPRMGVVDITVTNDGKQYTMEEAVKIRKTEFADMDDPWTVTAESQWRLPSGIDVVRFELDTPIGPARETVAVVNGRRVLFTGTESLELFESIAMSLQLE